jgi:hypothetical protein
LDLYQPDETVVDTEVERALDSDPRSSPGLFHVAVPTSVDADRR